MPTSLPPLLVLTGPTASGKTEVAVVMARRIGAQIISADSVQLYRHFDIGSAKPSAELMGQIKHHMIDVADPEDNYTVARYRDQAGAIARKLWAGGSAPLVVGGSGLYIRGLTQGLGFAVRISEAVNTMLDKLIAQEGQEGLYNRMKTVDPQWAGRVHPNDTFRTRRALGTYFTSGKTMSRIFAENPDRAEWDTLIVALNPPVDIVRNRIERRVDRMLAEGWRDEIKRLKNMGYNEKTKPMRSIGYRTLYDESEGLIDPETAQRQIVKKTKAFAKRQMTWLRGTPGTLFIDTGNETNAVKIAESIFKRDEVIQFLDRRGIRH